MAKAFLPVMAINLVNHPVNIIVKARTRISNFSIMGDKLCLILAKRCEGVNLKASFAQNV